MGTGPFKLAMSAASRRWQRRQAFAGFGDWFMTLYDALLRYARRVPLPLRRSVRPVRLANDPNPIYLRMGSSDGFVLEEIFLTHVYEPVTSAGNTLGPVKQIIDLGANAGFSVRLWRHRFPEARVIAVEPDPGNFAACKRNVEAAGGGDDNHVQLVQACVAGKPGTVYLDRSAEECAFTMTSTQSGEPIPALTLPMILDQCHADDVIDILKIDIEGAEREMFADCASWLGRVRSIMIELHPGYDRQMLMADLSRGGHNFSVRWQSETAGNPLIFLVREG
jgi:FkbM family methyltransferase